MKWPITTAPHHANIHMGEDSGSAFMTPSLTHSPVLSHFDTRTQPAQPSQVATNPPLNCRERECGDSFQAEMASGYALWQVSHVERSNKTPSHCKLHKYFGLYIPVTSGRHCRRAKSLEKELYRISMGQKAIQGLSCFEKVNYDRIK